jgi:hypothetical protein
MRLQPTILAENHVEIARRSGSRYPRREFKATLPPGSPAETAARQDWRDTGQRSHGWHRVPAFLCDGVTQIGQIFGRQPTGNLGARQKGGKPLLSRQAAHADRHHAVMDTAVADDHPGGPSR